MEDRCKENFKNWQKNHLNESEKKVAMCLFFKMQKIKIKNVFLYFLSKIYTPLCSDAFIICWLDFWLFYVSVHPEAKLLTLDVFFWFMSLSL